MNKLKDYLLYIVILSTYLIFANPNKELSFIVNWPGAATIHMTEFEVSNFYEEFKHGDIITAQINQFFQNPPVNTKLSIIKDRELIRSDTIPIDCEKILLGKNTETNDFKFFIQEAKDDEFPKLVQASEIRVRQDFYVEVIVGIKANICVSGWVELIEMDNNNNVFIRHRVKVDRINGDQFFTTYRSSKLQLSYESEPNQIKVADTKYININYLCVITSEKEYEELIKGDYHKAGYAIPIIQELEEEEGSLEVIVNGFHKGSSAPKGKLIITGKDGVIIEENKDRWEGGLPAGHYQIEYETMGERFGFKDIEVDPNIDLIVQMGGDEEFGLITMTPTFKPDVNVAYDETVNKIKYDLKYEYLRNGISELGSYSEALHQETYTIALNKDKNLLFSIPDSKATVVAGGRTEWMSTFGVLLLKKENKPGENNYRSAAVIKGKEGESPLFAFGEDTAKLFPVGSYTVELQKANSTQKVTKEFEIKPSEITIIDVDINSNEGQLAIKAFDKEDKETEYFVRIYKNGTY